TWTSPNTRADLPPNIRQLIQERYRARRAWQRIYDLSARSDMYRLAHDIKKAVREHQIKPGPTNPNGICHSPADKAEAFGDCMELQCSPNFQHANPDYIEEIEQSINELLEVAQPDKQTATTPKEIQEII
ncbi:hypothetical protein CBL_21404, partial [Carabus blaptoides fortunei]